MDVDVNIDSRISSGNSRKNESRDKNLKNIDSIFQISERSKKKYDKLEDKDLVYKARSGRSTYDLKEDSFPLNILDEYRGGISIKYGVHENLANITKSANGIREVMKEIALTDTLNYSVTVCKYGIEGPNWCTNTLGDIIEDAKLISQLTNRIILYGMDCHMSDWTLEAIKFEKIWVDNIDVVSVGNEALFRKEITPLKLFGRMADVRQEINSMGFKKKVLVFTSDLGSNVDAAYVAANNIMWANFHPYFSGVPVE
ncbi:5556_t:CDS:2 [Funneliformis geosporum]|nr:5556_t:CDS:2 [Funneliformis geosporum]